MDASAYFRGKRITVMGLGLLGGVGDIAYLAENGADIIATDLKNEEELRPSLEALKKFSNIRYTLGRHDIADFCDRDLIIKAPSTPLDSIYIAEARKNGIQVTMWSALFAKFAREAGAAIIGITGTRGKSTVTAMIASILRTAEKNVIEGGNMQGTSVLTQLAKVTADSIAVLELDSWKLQGFGEANISPNIGVFTTFYPDHMNYYMDNMDAYLADKANIFLYQKPEDTLILGKQFAATVIEKYGDEIKSKTVVVDELKLPDTWTLCIPGQHNRYNAALALAVARALGIDDSVSCRALESFAGVPGRLELIAEKNGVKIYNDTTSTTPTSTIAALSALGTEYTIVIAGGTDKNLELNMLVQKLKEAKMVILLAGNGTDRIKDQLPDATIYGSIADAVADAFAHAKSGDTILFSPAFTSFGMFKNEFDRGDQFVEQIKNSLHDRDF
ncbi:UDP-N-acetylmuramoyl-L-alanine--D-glutamate ligase [Candidatus Kaiserbacteria bacterium]|nr:UDP-N-acetylmuramoyl-L-alanine--D-glutamate ligase [Candidatus Kaiserbacteria bacterium]